MPGFDLERARRAHSATSHTPERRAEQERDAYTQHLAEVRATLDPIAQTEEQRAELDRLMSEYAAAYLARTYAVLDARARTMSPMITGPANFPAARNRKRMETELRRDDERTEWSKRAQKRMRDTLATMRTSDQIETDQYRALTRDLARSLATVERIDAADPAMRGFDRASFTVNAAARLRTAAGRGEHAAVRRALADVRAWQERTGREFWTARNRVWSLGDEPAATEEPSEAAAPSGREVLHDDGAGTVVYRNHEADRIQIAYPGKPEPATLERLKRAGWHWSPSGGVWQRKATAAAEWSARELVGAASPRTAGVSGEPSIQGPQGSPEPAPDRMAAALAILPYVAARAARYGIGVDVSEDRRGFRLTFPHDPRPRVVAMLENRGFCLSEDRNPRQWDIAGGFDALQACDRMVTYAAVLEPPVCPCGTASVYGDVYCAECGACLRLDAS